ncbi:acyl-CoA dehydrogenase family protein [Aquincola tertiaricarbonis]|uniref:acyl-CoA dehydrogenase family protein n=1 Tax=Aquincola tertiaricarbonis TaxID=391953 RepID=UPI000614C72B|nr:acyl-CoA dehydrogenase family protein [Aquincola tertiaricarbonis]
MAGQAPLPSDPFPHNQVPPLEDYNLYAADPVLQQAVRRAGADWHEPALMRQGAEYGAAATLQAAEDANRHPPELHTHSRTGERINLVRFHPAWHTMMAMARRNGIANLPFFDDRPSAWAARAASHMLHCQTESGSSCPTTMTHAAIPVLRRNPALYAVLEPLLASTGHDPADRPPAGKRSVTVGMGMTERQGGSDLRSNLTEAVPAGSGEWGDEVRITGHKWFFSAPMSDGHLVLARCGDDGLGCYFMPRWQPDGRRNAIHIQRLKDKVGNRSNSSAEVEFHGAWAVRVGEPGRGIAHLIDMASLTRLDCALSSAGFIRQALVQALHHARHRRAFGRRLVGQPLMAAVLADLAVESEAATLLAMDLAARHPGTDPLDRAWCRLLVPAAKFWICKRAVALSAEAMEVLGGNGYVEGGPLARLYREAPVNSIWEGSGNVMCLDVLRALQRHPAESAAVLQQLAQAVAGAPAVAATCGALQQLLGSPPAEGLEPMARLLTQRLVLLAQAALLLQHGRPATAAAFIDSRFGTEWGAVAGTFCQPAGRSALLEEAVNL